ncbi:MAG TPA: 3'-5' exonuclease [Clostridiales bacterium]|nr:3'-5' exonuclease [Clostridiales bacterium]HQP70015.1 3'-5' exonuclease [Clostridiales bacterium]
MKFELNERQRKAAEHIDGPLLIIAGAGSGKTRALVERIANIISSKKAYPSEIMAVTFTNKAAGELVERIVSRVGEIGKMIFAGTFHSLCAKILRRHADILGYGSNFVIYDSDDSEKVVREMIRRNNFNTASFPVKKVASIISLLKNRLIYPEDYNPGTDENFHDRIKDIYADYQKELIRCNAMDFDDLLCLTVKLFKQDKEVLFDYQNRIKYICVDEYQDTNYVQDLLITQLSALYENVCVVGDEDQSIYSWRGADINNILTFKDRHKNCGLIQFEQNYRSSGHILKAANSVILKNTQRLGKNLFTDFGHGEKVVLISSPTDIEEGIKTVSQINSMIDCGSELKEICVLYRTNSQSRIIEENLRKNGLPYTVVGGLKFYERKEIKDLISYLRLAVNPDDNVSFERVVNFPPRGIGKTTMEKIKRQALSDGTSYYKALKNADEGQFTGPTGKKINAFICMIEKAAAEMKKDNAKKITEMMLNQSGLKEHYLKAEDESGANSRIDNLYEFLSGVSEFVRTEDKNSLLDFLSTVSLLSDIDTYNNREDKIVLMTVHSAKGLEYDNVLIIGMNEGLFPFIRVDEPLKLEEERRLFYVAVTRARKKLVISTFRDRSRYFGDNTGYVPSRFLDDLPDNSTDKTGYEKTDKPQIRFDKFTKYEKNALNQEMEQPLSKKDIVLSKQFGEGIVLDVEGTAGRKVVTVDFDDFGIKKLLVRYADLKKL